MLDFGIDLLVFLSTRRNFFDYLLCNPIKVGKHTIRLNANNRRNSLAMGLYLFDRVNDKERVHQALEKLRMLDAHSEPNHKSMRALLKFAEIDSLMQKYDPEQYQRLTQII